MLTDRLFHNKLTAEKGSSMWKPLGRKRRPVRCAPMKPFITSHLLDVRSEQRESGEQCDLVYQYGQGFENGCDSRFRLQVQTDDRERDCFPSSDQVNTSRQWELHLSVFKSYRNICTPPQHHCGRWMTHLSYNSCLILDVFLCVCTG